MPLAMLECNRHCSDDTVSLYPSAILVYDHPSQLVHCSSGALSHHLRIPPGTNATVNVSPAHLQRTLVASNFNVLALGALPTLSQLSRLSSLSIMWIRPRRWWGGWSRGRRMCAIFIGLMCCYTRSPIDLVCAERC